MVLLILLVSMLLLLVGSGADGHAGPWVLLLCSFCLPALVVCGPLGSGLWGYPVATSTGVACRVSLALLLLGGASCLLRGLRRWVAVRRLCFCVRAG